MTFENLPCYNCRELGDEHESGKCLFQATCYTPVGEMDVLNALLFTRDSFREGVRLFFTGHLGNGVYVLDVWVESGMESPRITQYSVTEKELFRE